MLALVLQLAGVDRFEALGAAVLCPAFGGLASEAAAVASFPDLVRFGDGHLSVSVVDLFSIAPLRASGSCQV